MLIDREAKHKFEYTSTAICDHFCKYPLIWDERRFGPLSDSEVCEDCPLNQFEKDLQILDDMNAATDAINYSEGYKDGFKKAKEVFSITKEEWALLKKWRDNRGVSIEDFEDAMKELQECAGRDGE